VGRPRKLDDRHPVSLRLERDLLQPLKLFVGARGFASMNDFLNSMLREWMQVQPEWKGMQQIMAASKTTRSKPKPKPKTKK